MFISRINKQMNLGKSHFQLEQEKKKTQFHELIHAAFVLNSSVTFFLSQPQPTEKELSWLASTYPNSTIEKGKDQGAEYCTIIPKF